MPNTLNKGAEKLVIDSPAAIPGDGTLSASYAIPEQIESLTVAIRPVGTYTAIVAVLQIANNDVAGEYSDVYSSTAVAGELVVINPVGGRFFRFKLTSSTGASRTGLVVGVVAR